MHTPSPNLSRHIPVESNRLLSQASRSSLAAQLALTMVSLSPAAAARVYTLSFLGRELAMLISRGASRQRIESVCALIIARKFITCASHLCDLALLGEKCPQYRELANERISRFLRQVAGIV